MKQVTKGLWNGYDTYTLNSRDLEVTLLPRLGNNIISIYDRAQNREVVRRPDTGSRFLSSETLPFWRSDADSSRAYLPRSL